MEQYGRGVGVRGEMERRKVLRKVGGVAERQICKDERDWWIKEKKGGTDKSYAVLHDGGVFIKIKGLVEKQLECVENSTEGVFVTV